MSKTLFITEKPSVAREFAKILGKDMKNKDGYLESDNLLITWCVGHLVSMSYPEVYSPDLKKWSFQTLPFIPEKYKYEVIDNVKKQFEIVKSLLTDSNVETIYVCTDSGREGEYIYRLVEMQSEVDPGKKRKRVWIDSQTEDEIKRGIREAKDLSEYDALAESAFLRAKEDYLMGINFSRALTLKYGTQLKGLLGQERGVISVGRVMTCVLGLAVKREREIRAFEKQPFYRLQANFNFNDFSINGEWRVQEKSKYNLHPLLYKDCGFTTMEAAETAKNYLKDPKEYILTKIEKKKENKNPPLLYNLAELQNDCAKILKISPDETLKIAQELYEKKLTTYPRTDARVLSTAICKEISGNIKKIQKQELYSSYCNFILKSEMITKLSKTKYVDDKQITDHYAIIPTGVPLPESMKYTRQGIVYDMITRRFLSIFYPASVHQKIGLLFESEREEQFIETFISNHKFLFDPGYLTVTDGLLYKTTGSRMEKETSDSESSDSDDENQDSSEQMKEFLLSLKKNSPFMIDDLSIKEGETKPPSRFNSGSMILAMENAGQFIEDEDLRSQIKGSGIGTSATRAEILKKLFSIKYLSLNKKTQIITPTLQGEMIYEIVQGSIHHLLDPSLTASWEKGLMQVANKEITGNEYMEKLKGFVTRRTLHVKVLNNQRQIEHSYSLLQQYYK